MGRKKETLVVNPTNIKSHIMDMTISRMVYDYLNIIPKDKSEMHKRYHEQKSIRGAINGTNGLKPKRTILMVCQEIAKNHTYCEKMLKEFGDLSAYNAVYDWYTPYSQEQAPMWSNYDQDNKINLEQAMSYMLFNRMKPYLIDNKKPMFYDRFI